LASGWSSNRWPKRRQPNKKWPSDAATGLAVRAVLAIAEAVAAAVLELRAGQAAVAARRGAIAQELETIARRERPQFDAVADGDVTAGAICVRLRSERARGDALATELATLETTAKLDVGRAGL
jgi:hypothetical protein